MTLPEPHLDPEDRASANGARAWLSSDTAVAIFRTTFVTSVVIALWLRGQVFDFLNPAYVVSVLAALYNVALLVMYWRRRTFPGERHFILTLDVVFITLWVGLSGELGPVFFPLYYALMLVAALWFGIIGAAVTASVSAGLYIAVLYVAVVHAATGVDPRPVVYEALRERVPFLFVVAVLIGYLVDAQKRELQRFEELRDELAAYQLHRRLMQEFYDLLNPPALLSPPGLDLGVSFRAAVRMGAGDYYDLLELGGGQYGLCVADVAGKYGAEVLRVPAVKYALKAAAAVERRPSRVLERVNELVFDELQPDRFVTMFYAQVDPWAGRVTYVNAGHDSPLLMRRDGEVEMLEAGGLVLGVLRDARYEEGQVRLGPGDALVLYTDGAVDAADSSGAEFGIERVNEAARAALADTGSASAAAQTILSAIEDYASGGTRRDDVTIMVVRPAPRSSSDREAVAAGGASAAPSDE
jgi:serine phosphatase RsbU (regulator of sigma subunit)